MEKYKENNNYQIVDIARSKELLKIQTDAFGDSVKLSLLPYLILDTDKLVATTILKAQFFQKDDSILSNELAVHVCYEFFRSLPIVQEGDDKVKILNYEDVISMFDTSIGVFRGILFEWLTESALQHPLPAVNVEEFLKDLRISFSK